MTLKKRRLSNRLQFCAWTRTKKIFLHTSKPESAEYMTDSDHNVTMEEYRKNILKEGDIVLLLKLHKHEKYILIAKVVEAE